MPTFVDMYAHTNPSRKPLKALRLCAAWRHWGWLPLIGVFLWADAWGQTSTRAFKGTVDYHISWTYPDSIAGEQADYYMPNLWGDSCRVYWGANQFVVQFWHSPASADAISADEAHAQLRYIWLLPEQKRIYWQFAHTDTLYWAYGNDRHFTLYGMAFHPPADSLLGYALQSLVLLKRGAEDPLDRTLRVAYDFAAGLPALSGVFAPYNGILWEVYGRKARAVFLRYHVRWLADETMTWQAHRITPQPQEERHFPALPEHLPKKHDTRTRVLY